MITLNEDPGSLLHGYRVVIRNDEIAVNILESWKEHYIFDELAFENYNFENKRVIIREVKRTRRNKHPAS